MLVLYVAIKCLSDIFHSRRSLDYIPIDTHTRYHMITVLQCLPAFNASKFIHVLQVTLHVMYPFITKYNN